MAIICERKLGDYVPHEVMSYHSCNSVSDMSRYIVKTDADAPDARTFGKEIECTKMDSPITQEEIDEMFEICPYIQIESDGSIPSNCYDSSCEIITAPMTLNAMKECGLKELLDWLIEHGFKAYEVTNRDTGRGCGGHTHISKGQDWEKVVGLMAMVIDQNKEIVQIICKRSFTDYAINNLAGLGNSSKRRSLEYVTKYVQEHSGNHSNVLNLQHSATIEFRLPVGTLDYDTIMAHTEFLNNLYQCCDDVIHSKARIDRLTINKICKDGEFLPKLMDELCISCSRKLVIYDKLIKARIDAYNIEKYKIVKALSDLQLALAITNDASIPNGSINNINTHFTNITGASTIDDELLYMKNLVTSRVISRGLEEYADGHNNTIAKAYLKLKDLCSNMEIPVIYEDMKGEK